ncbi:beta-lactamase family protein [Pelomyxa schiedti]|nr:beta-lactamase family protein [Pelomyxa schiedti]
MSSAWGQSAGENPSWANWTWYSWQAGPPCPRDYRDVPPVSLSEKGPVSLALKEISSLLQEFIMEYKLRYGLKLGMGLGIIYNGEVIFLEGGGTVSMDSDVAPDGDTIWNVGSITKVFTTLLLMKGITDGIVHLDDPVTKFYNQEAPPIFDIKNPYGNDLSGVCMHSLSTHTSGLPREAPCQAFNCGYNESIIFEYINAMLLLYPPFVQPHYSNFGLSLMGHCLERAYAGTYEDIIVDQLLSPMGMNSSGFHYTDDVKNRMATGYTLNAQGNQVEYAYNTEEQGWSAPCGGMYSSISDLLKFLHNAVLGGESPVGDDRSNMFKMSGTPMPDGVSGYGLGTFEDVYANGFNTITKGGLVGGFGSNVAFIPELKLGMAATINLGSSSPDTLLAESFLLLLPALLKELDSNQPPPSLPENYQHWLGKYGYSHLNVLLSIEESGQAGVLNGTLFGTPQIFTWDPVQQEMSAAGAAFRMVDATSLSESCHNLYAVSKDAVAYFGDILGIPVVTVTDQNIWNIPKLLL